MSFPFVQSANTKAKASEANSNWAHNDYTAIDNNKLIQFDNAAGVLDCAISEDASDNLIISIGTAGKIIQVQGQNTTNMLRLTDDASFPILNLQGGGRFDVSDSGNTDRTSLYHDGGNAFLETNDGGIRLIPAADGDPVVIHRMPRRSEASDTYQNTRFERGWLFKNGTGAAVMSEAVSFETAFASDNVSIMCNYVGIQIGSDPTDEGSTSGAGIIVNATDVTTAGFNAFWSTSATLTAGNRYAISWLAVGPV